MRLSIIIPAHDEGHRISKVLGDYLNYFTENSEVWVVLDHCNDNTLDIVKEFEARYRNLDHGQTNVVIGKGAAILEGFKVAQGDVIAYVDADDATKATELDHMVSELGDFDGIIGSRWLKDSVVVRPQTLSRKIASRVFNLMVRIMFGLPFLDTQCGAKAFKRAAIQAVLPELGTTSFAFDVDLLYLLKRKGFKIREFPIVWEDQPGSTLELKRAAPVMFAAIVRLRIKHSVFANLITYADKKIYSLFRRVSKYGKD
jgi:glycosyltransferase involved in cell wall biosynthesis